MTMLIVSRRLLGYCYSSIQLKGVFLISLAIRASSYKAGGENDNEGIIALKESIHFTQAYPNLYSNYFTFIRDKSPHE